MIENDTDLIHGCRRNNREAQNLLFKKFGKKVLAVCCRYASSTDEAKDLQQETFIKVFHHLQKSHIDIQSLEAWVVRIAVNTSIDYFRSLRKIQEMHSNEPTDVVVLPDIWSQLNEEDLIQLIQQIPNPYRLVFNLYIVEGFSHKEIGEKLEITESTSRSYLTRAKEHLKKKIFPVSEFKERKVWTT